MVTSARPTTKTAKSSESNPARVQWDLSSSPTGTSILTLHGDLKPGWLGRLSSHLSSNTISIISGSARKASPLCWDASFDLDVKECNPEQLKGFSPFPAPTEAKELIALTPLKISDFQVERSMRHGGSIYAEISGKDCIGFLYNVLKIFSFYSFFPIELEIATTGMTAIDRFWLKGIGSSVPTEEDTTALHARLATLLEESYAKSESGLGILSKMNLSR